MAVETGSDSLVARRQALPLTAAMTAVVAWGMGPVLVKAISAEAPAIVFFRLWLAFPFMYAAMRITGGRWSVSLARMTFGPAVLFALTLVTSFESFQRTSIANATLIPALLPALVLLVAPKMFGDRRSRKQLICAGVSFAGVAAVVIGAGGTGGAGLAGDALAAMNLVLFTGYFLWVAKIRAGGLHPFSYLFSVFAWSAILVTPWVLLSGADLHAIGGTDWFLLLGMVIGPGIVGHGLMTWAQRYVPVTTASLLTLANPVISMFGAWIVHHQGLRPVQMVGAAVVLVGLAGIVLEHRSAALVARAE